jgi:hypothetical protein
MNEGAYRAWLDQKYDNPLVKAARISNCRTVEKNYGDLDTQYDADKLASLLQTLRYSRADETARRANPTKIPINGDLRTGLATLKSAVTLYKMFRDNEHGVPIAEPVDPSGGNGLVQRMSLERDLQAALRARIEQIEPGLVIIDDGAERSVGAGLIDITARDASGAVVVIELKAGAAGAGAIAQILSYMGDVLDEEAGAPVRGIVVASDFDHRARSAARMVPNVRLYQYAVSFSFSDESGCATKSSSVLP